jgi:hypothetical protein
VWNSQMREEAIRYHGLPPDAVCVCGAPQFDNYFTRTNLPTRDSFFASVDADPNKRLITLATTAAGTYDGTPAIISSLSEAMSANAFGEPAQLLVRLHPRDTLSAYEGVAQLPGVVLDRSIRRLEDATDPASFDDLVPNREERAHLAATLAYSDVVINFASTTTVEACIFDTPVINIGFDPVPDAPLPLSIRRYFSYEHYRPVLAAGAVRIAQSTADLIAHIRAYLKNPSLDRAGRQRLVDEVCEFSDGRSAERVTRAVVDALDALAPIPHSGQEPAATLRNAD